MADQWPYPYETLPFRVRTASDTFAPLPTYPASLVQQPAANALADSNENSPAILGSPFGPRRRSRSVAALPDTPFPYTPVGLHRWVNAPTPFTPNTPGSASNSIPPLQQHLPSPSSFPFPPSTVQTVSPVPTPQNIPHLLQNTLESPTTVPQPSSPSPDSPSLLPTLNAKNSPPPMPSTNAPQFSTLPNVKFRHYQPPTPDTPPRLHKPCLAPPEVPNTIPRARTNERRSKSDKIASILAACRQVDMAPAEFLHELLSGSDPAFTVNRAVFFRKTSPWVSKLLDQWWKRPAGKLKIEQWMRKQDRALDIVCADIKKKMEVPKLSLVTTAERITIDELQSWSINDTISKLGIPKSWRRVLASATQGPMTDSNKKKKQTLGHNVITMQALFLRSQKAIKLSLGLGLFAWSCGASKQLLEVLNHCNLTPSYSTIWTVVKGIGDGSVQEATRAFESVPTAGAYDNIDISHSIHVEQRPDAPQKVNSGTFPVIYELYNARFEDMLLEPMLEKAKTAGELNRDDIDPDPAESAFYQEQVEVHIVKALIRHVDGFKEYEKDPSLQHTPRRALPRDHRTRYHTLRIRAIGESSTKGNLHVHDDTYTAQLKQDPASPILSLYARPLFIDLMTLMRIRSCLRVRIHDLNAWERREVFAYALGMGLFHLILNLVWMLNRKYAGNIRQVGTLRYWFAKLDKVRLQNPKPDYHALLTTLEQILDGILLYGWSVKCGFTDLDDFATSEPSAEALRNMAKDIFRDFGTVVDDYPVVNEKAKGKKQQDDDDEVEGEDEDGDSEDSETKVDEDGSDNESDEENHETLPKTAQEHHEILRRNLRLLVRDLLCVVELVTALKDGDFGRVEALYPDLARLFRGGGCHNYSNEILHWIYNVRHVWTEEFANIMRDNSIVNIGGKFKAIDVNIENLIRYIKHTFAAKGIHASWDLLGHISAAIKHLMEQKTQIGQEMGTSHQKRGHTDPDTRKLVLRVYDDLREMGFATANFRCADKTRIKPMVDLRAKGHNYLARIGLERFNKRMQIFKEDGEFEPEIDRMEQPEFADMEVSDFEDDDD